MPRRTLHAVEHHGRRVGALRPAHDGRTRARGPRLQLLTCGGAERVAGGHEHAATERNLLCSDLGEARGFSGAVHADHQPDVGHATREVEGERTIGTGEARRHIAAQGGDE
jgi:hypothetical protein